MEILEAKKDCSLDVTHRETVRLLFHCPSRYLLHRSSLSEVGTDDVCYKHKLVTHMGSEQV